MSRSPRSGFDWSDEKQDCPSRAALREWGLPTGPLADAMVTLDRYGGGRKRHLVGTGRQWADCMHSRYPADGEVVALLDLDWNGLCLRCARIAIHGLDAPRRAYVRLATVVGRARQWVVALESSTPQATWTAYARFLATVPFDDGRWHAALAAYADLAPAEAVYPVTTLWTRLERRARRALAAAAGVAARNTPDRLVAARQVLARLTADPQVRAESDRIAALAGDVSYTHRFDVWAKASAAWYEAVRRDAEPDTAHAAMHHAVEARYAHRPVRDVTLIENTTLPGSGFAHPMDWANAEFAEHRARTVARWAQALTTALDTAADDTAADTPQRLVAMTHWPPARHENDLLAPGTRSDDEPLAYLTRYPVVSRVVSTSDLLGIPTHRAADASTGWVITVLRVPAHVADHVEALAASGRRWVRLAPPGWGSSASAAAALLADVALVTDRDPGAMTADDAEAVLAARAAAADAYRDQPLPVRLHDTADPGAARGARTEVVTAWLDGRPWIGPVPDMKSPLPGFEDDAGLRSLLAAPRVDRDQPVRLTVLPVGTPFADSGPIPVTAVVDHVDPVLLWLRTPRSDTRFTVPLQRVVSVAAF